MKIVRCAALAQWARECELDPYKIEYSSLHLPFPSPSFPSSKRSACTRLTCTLFRRLHLALASNGLSY